MCSALALANAAPARGDTGVNPLTGTPLSLERAHWALEQARLDEQLQASLLNRRKFELERQRLDAGSGVPAGLTGEGLPGGAVASGDGVPAAPGSGFVRSGMRLDAVHPGLAPTRVAAPAMASADAAGEAQHLLTRAANVSAGRPRGAWSASAREPAARRGSQDLQVLGVRADAAHWCLLIGDGLDLRPACPGEWHAGHHIDAVRPDGYVLDGTDHHITIPATRISAMARRSPDHAVPTLDSTGFGPADAGHEDAAQDGPGGASTAPVAEPGSALTFDASAAVAGSVAQRPQNGLTQGPADGVAGTPLQLRVPADLLH